MSPLPNTPDTLFLQKKGDLLWVEVLKASFSRHEISDYLTKASRIQSRFPSGISGILIAPDFEAGVQELMELVKFPVRLFKYREENSPPGESVGWLEEITLHGKPAESTPPEEPLSLCNRLNREELREFIQLEIDVARGRHNKS